MLAPTLDNGACDNLTAHKSKGLQELTLDLVPCVIHSLNCESNMAQYFFTETDCWPWSAKNPSFNWTILAKIWNLKIIRNFTFLQGSTFTFLLLPRTHQSSQIMKGCRTRESRDFSGLADFRSRPVFYTLKSHSFDGRLFTFSLRSDLLWIFKLSLSSKNVDCWGFSYFDLQPRKCDLPRIFTWLKVLVCTT